MKLSKIPRPQQLCCKENQLTNYFLRVKQPTKAVQICCQKPHGLSCNKIQTRKQVIMVSCTTNENEEIFRISEGGWPRTATVGVLGGGQLGRMMALAAGNMGVKIKFLDPTENAPASVAAEQVLGSFRDAEAIKKLAEGIDILTAEIEHIDATAMEAVAEQFGVDVQPAPFTLKVIQVFCFTLPFRNRSKF
eukprot:TRINITY_DN14239_c0_g1_i3.p2 TRINITY_DN14239_c0_g1~~TRINITY_DN14239_c0_g1_i3.p2  ORF type:complete len:203 (-),score=18.04 TRINITY_DN14239_c0_g1_i3:82-654(-)